MYIFMYLYVCIYIYTYIYICMYIYTHARIHIYISTHTYIHTYSYIFTCIYRCVMATWWTPTTWLRRSRCRSRICRFQNKKAPCSRKQHFISVKEPYIKKKSPTFPTKESFQMHSAVAQVFAVSKCICNGCFARNVGLFYLKIKFFNVNKQFAVARLSAGTRNKTT